MKKWLRDQEDCEQYVPEDKKKGDWSNYWACRNTAQNNYFRCLKGEPPVPFEPYGPDYPDPRFPEPSEDDLLKPIIIVR